jgi:hypothetical protein
MTELVPTVMADPARARMEPSRMLLAPSVAAVPRAQMFAAIANLKIEHFVLHCLERGDFKRLLFDGNVKFIYLREATLTISNQKNDTHGKLIHHETINQAACPRNSLGIHHIMSRTNNNAATPSSACQPAKHEDIKHVRATHINTRVKDQLT